ncbi:MAG: AIR synthase-related protein [Opitutae bacterium]|jgi:phosphoribosylformylglycinamidine cyclo-ligase|nr:AIR synthase-related protein [Opitutae bacterium]
MNQDRYSLRGVSSTKDEVHAVVDKMSKGLFPGAFCKINPDFLTGNPDKCCVIHSDGSGTKSTLAYLHFKETGDPSAFRKTAQDSMVMNIDDLICIGVTDNILISSTINRNARNIPGPVLAELISGTESFLQSLRDNDILIHSGGGETADVGDLTPTVTVDSCAVAVMDREQVIDNANIKPGLSIVGLASYGQASYENFYNSGIGSNGLTSARHDLLKKDYYEKYPETTDRQTDSEYLYCGPYKMNDPLPESNLTVGEALLSPTRTYAPVVKKLLSEYRSDIKGMVHCSGGGQTKCLRFGTEVHFIKDSLLPIPPIFKAIQKASQTSDEEMYRVYNMGHRLEIYCLPEIADAIIQMSQSFGIEAAVIGRTESIQSNDNTNTLTIHHQDKKLNYKI